MCACEDIIHTGATYSAIEQHRACVVVLVVLVFVSNFELANFFKGLLGVVKTITICTTKADYTIEVLMETVFQYISPWLDTHLAEIKYEDMKAMLPKKFNTISSECVGVF